MEMTVDGNLSGLTITQSYTEGVDEGTDEVVLVYQVLEILIMYEKLLI